MPVKLMFFVRATVGMKFMDSRQLVLSSFCGGERERSWVVSLWSWMVGSVVGLVERTN